MSDVYTLAVEEEYQLVDPHSRELCGQASKVSVPNCGPAYPPPDLPPISRVTMTIKPL